MSARSFVVFQDTPFTDTVKSKHSDNATSDTPSSPGTIIANLPSTTEKENVHPLTGERAGPSTISKKRKNSVLSTKDCLPLTIKVQKAGKGAQPETKKRKSSSSASKAKAIIKKDTKVSGSARKAKPMRRASPLPKVDETAEEEKERRTITQAEIDSRCYELTVQPLADVSRAYDQSPPVDNVSSEDKVKFSTVKESSTEPELRDYIAPASFMSSGSKLVSNAIEAAAEECKSFNTPERKRIYAAFTFSSPSPTSERYSKVMGSASIPRLQLTPRSPSPQ